MQEHNSKLSKTFTYSEFSKGNKPRFSSIIERKEFDKMEARKKINLTNTN